MLLPSASKKLEKSIAVIVKKASRDAADDESWLSTDDLFDILRQLQDILEIFFYEIGPELPLPSFLKSYSLTLRSHFMAQTVCILNVPCELLVGRYLNYLFLVLWFFGISLNVGIFSFSVHWPRTLPLLAVQLSHRESYSLLVTRSKRKWNAS